MKEVISCLNSPALLNQKIELQSSHIMETAVSKPASKERFREFHREQDTEKKHTHKGNQMRCLRIGHSGLTIFYFHIFLWF